MPDATPVPPAIWKRFLEFLKDHRTGQVTFHVHRGRIQDARIEEMIRPEEEARTEAR
jgi:hypothetical protein